MIGTRTRFIAVPLAKLVALCAAYYLFRLTYYVGIESYYLYGPQIALLGGILVIGVFARHDHITLVALAYATVFFGFIELRSLADETPIPVQFSYPVIFDKVFFLGRLPNVVLQDLFYVKDRLGPVDIVLSAVYVSYFVAPHLTGLLIWKTRRELFPRVATAIMLTFVLGLGVYFLVPTAPPWLAADSGQIEEVRRLIPEIVALLTHGSVYQDASTAVDGNPVAAMPSLHVAITVVVALAMAEYGKAWRRLGVVYVCGMCLALVYLGEHYVIDEVAGLLLGIVVWRITPHFRNREAPKTRAPSPDYTEAP